MGGLVTALTLAAILFLWAWSVAGTAVLAATTNGPTFRARARAASAAYAILFVLTILASFELAWLPPPAVGVGAALALFLHADMDPRRVGFWHHRRLRPIGVVFTLALGAALGVFIAWPALIPAAFACAIFHRHQLGALALAEQAYADVDAMRVKLLSQITNERFSAQTAHEARDDRGSEAG